MISDSVEPTYHSVESRAHFSIGNLQRILHGQKSFRTVYQSEDHRRLDEVERGPMYTRDLALESPHRDGPPQSIAPSPQSDMAAPNLETKLESRLSEQLCRLVAQ